MGIGRRVSARHSNADETRGRRAGVQELEPDPWGVGEEEMMGGCCSRPGNRGGLPEKPGSQAVRCLLLCLKSDVATENYPQLSRDGQTSSSGCPFFFSHRSLSLAPISVVFNLSVSLPHSSWSLLLFVSPHPCLHAVSQHFRLFPCFPISVNHRLSVLESVSLCVCFYFISDLVLGLPDCVSPSLSWALSIPPSCLCFSLSFGPLVPLRAESSSLLILVEFGSGSRKYPLLPVPGDSELGESRGQGHLFSPTHAVGSGPC